MAAGLKAFELMKLKWLLLASLVCVGTARAAGTVPDASVAALGSLNKSGLFSTSTFTPAVVGYQFTALTDIRIVSMGIFDQGGDGLIASADVGIYNLSGELLRRVAIPPSSPLRGEFRYELLDVPLVVASGTSLRVAHFVGAADPWVFRADVTDFSPLIQYNGSVSTNTSNPSSLIFPDGNFSSRREYLGTDFEFQVIPEPSAFILLSVGACFLLQRRRS
jgi:hypothetical protein